MKKIFTIAFTLLITQITFSESVVTDHIKVGDRVIDEFNFTGTIKKVFPNGQTKVQLDGILGHISLADRSLKDLAKSYPCIQNACVGARVIDKFKLTGTVKEVFSNGQTKVQLDGILGHIDLADRSLNDLGYPINCSRQSICLGKNHSSNGDQKLNEQIKEIVKLKVGPKNECNVEILDSPRDLKKDSPSNEVDFSPRPSSTFSK